MSGGWQLGDIDCSEYLDTYRDHEVVAIASVLRVVTHPTSLDQWKRQLKCDFCRIETAYVAVY